MKMMKFCASMLGSAAPAFMGVSLAASSSGIITAAVAVKMDDDHISPSAVRDELQYLKDAPMFPEVPGTAVAVRGGSDTGLSTSTSASASLAQSRVSSSAGVGVKRAGGGGSNKLAKKGKVGSISGQDGQRYPKVLSAKATDPGGFARA